MAVGSLFCIVSLIISIMWMAEARIPGNYAGSSWQTAHATFYGGSDASGTMGMYHILLLSLSPLHFQTLYMSVKVHIDRPNVRHCSASGSH